MSYISQIKDYCGSLPQELQTEVIVQVKKLRIKGFSYEWIHRAITYKKPSDWKQWGFGLL